MRAFLFSFLAVGLTGVLAAPASPESELEARSPCNLLCKPGYTAVYNPVTGKCKCVLNNEEICLRETLCIGTHHPVWDPKTKTCTCEPYDFSAEEKCLREQICIGTHHAVWNPTTKKCTCELTVFVDPDKEKCLLATTCLEGSHAFWNPVTKKCSCNPNDGEFICKAATTCIPGSTPIWHTETETCVCEKVGKRQNDFPDPKTCPTIRCMDGYRPKYVPGLSHCICEKIPVPDPKTCPTIKCSAGYKPVYNPKTKTCSCKPDPTQCVGWVCIAEKQPVYDPITGKCGCQWIPGLEPVPINPCADILCIAEMTPKVNTTTGLCECEWIPGLEPGAPTYARAAQEAQVEERTPEAAPEPQTFHPACRGIYCIAEKRPVYNATSKRCQCEWIPGLGPVTLIEREPASPTPTPYDPLNCYWLKVYCEGGDHHMHYDPKSKSCKCPPVITPKPTIPDPTLVVLKCEDLKVYCEFGDHYMHWDPVSQTCKCPEK